MLGGSSLGGVPLAGDLILTPPGPPSAIAVISDRPPLRLNVNVETFSGANVRWGEDEVSAGNVPTGINFSTTAPGGFENFSCTLSRKMDRSDPDLQDLSRLTVRGTGGEIVYQGRIQVTAFDVGDGQTVSPQAVGLQALLADDNSAREIYIDPDLTKWQQAGTQRQINNLVNEIDTLSPSSLTDPTSGFPAVLLQVTGKTSREASVEAWYDAQGIPIGHLYWAWQLQAPGQIGDYPTLFPGSPLGQGSVIDQNFNWYAYLSTDSVASSVTLTPELLNAWRLSQQPGSNPAGPMTGTLTATVGARFAVVQLLDANGGGAVTDGVNYSLYWTVLGVFGTHGLPIVTPAQDQTHAGGILASDIVANAVGRWAPGMGFTTGVGGTIRPSQFPIPAAAYTDPTTAANIISDVTRYELQDWFVWEGPTFYWAPRQTFARYWRARSFPAKLQQAGSSADRVWNGVIVPFTDVSGVSRCVGPTGSGADIEDSSLLDPDPLNVANQAGIRKWQTLPSIGTNDYTAAIKVGQVFLRESKLLDTSGSATLTGHVQDDRGIWWPAWRVRAGDYISFVDARDTSYRRIVRTDYSHDSRTNQLTLDAPPQGLQQLLERLGAETGILGF